MWEYFQRSQNACSVSSALHQLVGTLLIRQGTGGIRVGGRGGWKREGGGVRKKCLCIYAQSSIYFHLTLELSVFPRLPACCISPSGYVW